MTWLQVACSYRCADSVRRFNVGRVLDLNTPPARRGVDGDGGERREQRRGEKGARAGVAAALSRTTSRADRRHVSRRSLVPGAYNRSLFSSTSTVLSVNHLNIEVGSMLLVYDLTEANAVAAIHSHIHISGGIGEMRKEAESRAWAAMNANGTRGVREPHASC